jgi:hypothetical protein
MAASLTTIVQIGGSVRTGIGLAGLFAIEPSDEIVVSATGNVGKDEERSILLDAKPNGALDRRLGSAAGFRPNPAKGGVWSGGGHRLLLTSRGDFGSKGLLARAFGPRGTVDRSFGSQGAIVVAPPKGSDFNPIGAARQSDGRIVVAGETSHRDTVDRVELVGLC